MLLSFRQSMLSNKGQGKVFIWHPFCLVPSTSTDIQIQYSTQSALSWHSTCQKHLRQINNYNKSTKRKLSLTLSSPMLLRLHTLPYWSNPPFLIFWHSGALALRTERQGAQMSKIKNGELHQYGAEPFKQQPFGTAGVEGLRDKRVEVSKRCRPWLVRQTIWFAVNNCIVIITVGHWVVIIAHQLNTQHWLLQLHINTVTLISSYCTDGMHQLRCSQLKVTLIQVNCCLSLCVFEC